MHFGSMTAGTYTAKPLRHTEVAELWQACITHMQALAGIRKDPTSQTLGQTIIAPNLQHNRSNSSETSSLAREIER
jgi:hypothetical protein